MDDIEKAVQEYLAAQKKSNPTRLQFYADNRLPPEAAVMFFKDTNIPVYLPDGSKYIRGNMVKGPTSAWSASPETLRRLNARIATMDLSPQRREKEKFEYHIMGIWNIKEEE